jgi:hypothetical protein
MADFTLANIPPFLIPGKFGKFGKFEALSPLPANRAGRLHGRPGGGAISIVFVQSSKSAEGTAAIVPIAPR